MTASARLLSPVAIALAIVLSISVTASAQSGSARPLPVFRGLFGPDERESTRPRSLDINWNVYSAQDDNTFLANDTDVLDTPLQANRIYTGATIGMTYKRRPKRNALTLSASGAGRYYADLREIVSTRYSGGMLLDSSLTRDWKLQLAESLSYSPLYTLAVAPSDPASPSIDAPVPVGDDAAAKQQSMQYGSFLGLTHTISARTSLAMNYSARYTQVLDGGTDTNTQRGGVSYTHGLTKYVGLRLGYAYGLVLTGPGTTPIRSQDLDLGLSYGRAFAPSRRTTFGFSSGSSFVTDDDGSLHYVVTGSAHLSRRLAPRWTSQLLYDRGLSVPDGATRPFFADTVAGNISGYLSDRISVRLQPAYAHGVVGFSGLTNSYNSGSNTTRLEMAISHHLALYVEHFIYRYQFANGVGLPPALRQSVDRQGARVGLTLWTPLVQ
ncbi:MAG TPA: hypothetical protein VNG89_07945 [Vicinamibacterales bacterium]|nr:hypothetical protein [Vicinamibacterales bacterium]